MHTPSSTAIRLITSGLLATAVLSCGDGNGGSGPSGTFSISAPTTLTVQAGSSGTVQVTVTRTGGFSGAVALDLEDHPDNITHSLAVVPGSGTAATLTVTVAVDVAPGTYTVKLCGNATGLSEQNVVIVLTVTPAPPGGFTVSLNPASLSLEQGQTGTVAVTVSRTAPFTGAVTLGVFIAPPGVLCTFDPSPIPAGTTSATLTVAVAGGADPGAYPLVFSWTGTGVDPQEVQLLLTVTARPGEFALAVDPASLTLEQGKPPSAVGITITRTPPWESRVALALEGVPAGVMALLVPILVPPGGTASTLHLGAMPTAVPGVYTLVIHATGPGAPERTASVTLTITEPPGFTLQAGSVGVPQGRVGGAGIKVVRKGGFTGPVNLALEGALPAGVTATLAWPTIPEGQELDAINFSVLATAPVGFHHLTLHGTALGVPDISLQVTFEVRAAPSGNVTFRFCNAAEIPIWFGYQNGSEQWTQVAGPGGVFNFPITSGKGGVAWVVPWQDEPGFYVGMFLGTQAELVELGSIWCQHTPSRKNLTGAVANVGSDWYNVSIGDASVEIHGGAGLDYQLTDVPVGPFDLVASKTTIPVGSTSSTMIIRRGINYPAGGVIPLLDFASGEAFLTTTKNATVENLGAEVFKFTQAYVTVGGTIGQLAHRDPKVVTTPYMVIPAAQAQAGDFYNVKVETSWQQDGAVNRMVINSFDVPNDQTLNLGPALTPPSVFTLQAAPFYQVRVMSSWQAEYGNLFNGSFLQDTRDGEFYVTRGYLGGGGTIDLTTPDLRFVPGWKATWGPISGAMTVLQGMAYGWTGTTGALFPGFLADFVTTPNVSVSSAALYAVTVP